MSLVPSSLLASTPPEILSSIVAESDAGTLANWCGVNKTFLAEAGPLLYHTVVINSAENVMPFIERLRAFRASSPVPGSPDYRLHTLFKAVRHLDILAYPPPELLVALADVVQPASTATHLELTLYKADQTEDGLAGFWVPRLLLALRPTVYRFREVYLGGRRIRETTVPPLHLAVWLPALSILGPAPSHPDQVPKSGNHYVLHCVISACVGIDTLQLGRFLQRVEDGEYDLASSSFDVEEYRAWVMAYKPYFAVKPDSSVEGWASVERMLSWHRRLVTQRKAYADKIYALSRTSEQSLIPCNPGLTEAVMAKFAALTLSSNH